MCDAHRVAHAHPSAPDAFAEALDAAWTEGRHSVVEVTTSRAKNLEQHRAVQRAAAKAAEAALRLRVRAGVARVLPSVHRRADEEIQTGTGGSSDPAARLRVVSASVTRFDAAMRREPTTTGYAAGASDPTRDEGPPVRSGWLLRLELRCGAVGWGEASPSRFERGDAREAGAQLRRSPRSWTA